MRRSLTFSLMAMLAMLASAANSQDVVTVSNVSMSQQITSMQAELESLRSEFSQVSYGQDADGYKGDGNFGGRSGWLAGFELAILRPHLSTFNYSFEADADTDAYPDPRFGYKASPRVWLGYQTSEGLGMQVRYWTIDQSTGLHPVADPEVDEQYHGIGVEATTLDFEMTQLVCWGPLQANFSGGLRYGKIDTAFSENATAEEGFGNDIFNTGFEGVGPTAAVNVRRPIRCGDWALIGNSRGSLLFGDRNMTLLYDDEYEQTNGAPESYELIEHYVIQDIPLGVIESQMGLEYSRILDNGGKLSFRALMEGQLWWEQEAAEEELSNIGFFGATLGLQYEQ